MLVISFTVRCSRQSNHEKHYGFLLSPRRCVQLQKSKLEKIKKGRSLEWLSLQTHWMNCINLEETEILEELKKIRETKEKLLSFAQHRHQWNQLMITKCKGNNIDIYHFPDLHDSFGGFPKDPEMTHRSLSKIAKPKSQHPSKTRKKPRKVVRSVSPSKAKEKATIAQPKSTKLPPQQPM